MTLNLKLYLMTFDLNSSRMNSYVGEETFMLGKRSLSLASCFFSKSVFLTRARIFFSIRNLGHRTQEIT